MRARVKWSLILALPAALIGIGCSGGNGAAEGREYTSWGGIKALYR